MYGNDYKDAVGKLEDLEHGSHSMDLVCTYLKGLNLAGLPLDIMMIKLEHLYGGLNFSARNGFTSEYLSNRIAQMSFIVYILLLVITGYNGLIMHYNSFSVPYDRLRNY